MKNLITALLFTLFAATAFGQTELDKKLFQAVSDGDSVHVEKYLKEGANANVQKGLGFLKMSQLIIAVQKKHVKIVKLLVDNKADVNFKDAFKTTSLMYAAHSGNLEIATYLITHGADINANDEQGNSVLSAAKESKNPEMITLIESSINKKVSDK